MDDALRIQLLETGLLPLAILLLMLVSVELGWRVGWAMQARRPGIKASADTALIGAIFGLLALLIAFTFSGASNRFDQRRHLIIEEVIAIHTAYVAIDFLAAPEQPRIRQLFKDLLDHRIAFYDDVMHPTSVDKKTQEQAALKKALWQASLQAVMGEKDAFTRAMARQLLTDVAKMFDAIDVQRLAMKFHPPRVVWFALFLMALVGSFMAGHKMGLTQERDWLVIIVFASLMAGTVFLTMNMEYPRIGSINLDEFDQELVSLRGTM